MSAIEATGKVTGLVVLIIFNKWLSEKEITLLFFVLVSLISAPHIWIMNRFLEKNKSSKLTRA